MKKTMLLSLANLQEKMRSRVSRFAGIAGLCCLLFALATPAWAQGTGYTYSVYDFQGSPTDGSMIEGGALDSQGNLYGNAVYGGANSCSPPYPAAYGCGAIVKWDTSGKETVLHSFAGTDGAAPLGSITLDGQGNLYGTTYAGGDLTCNAGEGCGTVFKLNLSTLKFTVIHNFEGGTGDGIYSESPLLLDAQGNLYGTTDDGGVNSNGTVFKVDTAGNETLIYSAPSGSEWGAQLGAVDAWGNIYGTSRGGGANSEGSVFMISSSDVYTTIYSFTGGSDGSNPRVLKRDALGNLYGNTKSGSLYKLTLQANGTYKFSSVQSFAGTGPGVWPDGTVIDAQGNQYGYSSQGGDLACDAPTGCGTVYKIDTSNNQTVLHAFTGTNGDGTGPDGLLADALGNLFGGTGGGLSSCSAPGGNGTLVTGCGTVFKLALPSSIATTTTTLTSSQSSSTYGQAVTLTAEVVASAGAPPNGETIVFMYGPILLGEGTLSSGTASLTTTALPYGTDSVTAVYPGDPNFAGSQSNAISQQVSQASSTTTLTSSPNPSDLAQNVTFTTTVSGQYGGIATGSVTFSNGSTTLGTVSLSGGSAVFAISALPQGTQLPLGTNSITAVYSGDANFAGSTSNTESQVVTSVPSGTLEWTWMGGSSTVPTSEGGGQPGVYGTLELPASGNYPGSRDGAVSWTDSSGNLWLFGGSGWDATRTYQLLNDLWEFSPSSKQWTWIGGSSTGGQSGVYGTEGSPAAGNIPGGRQLAASWTDKSGNFWLFGGYAANAAGYLNDFWMFNPSTKQWTWMGGSSTGGQTGVFGTLGTPAAGNFPGNRTGASSWVDSSGNFWLFGGFYYNANNSYGFLNDLWEYNPSTNQWTWMAGGNAGGQSGVYGTQGTGAAGNTPGARSGAVSWTDSSGSLWLFGGLGLDSVGAQWGLNDLWRFSPSTGNWTWMGGQVTGGQAAVYGTLGFPAAANIPGGRSSANGWTDSSGNLWLFGGLYANDNFSDLWEFSPFTNQWAWMGGSKTISCGTYGCGLSGVYGTQGTPAPGNNPAGRVDAASWIDSSGNFWLFGGLVEETYGNTSYYAYLNDLWKYQPSTASLPAAVTPTFSPVAGTYTSAQSVTISDTTTGATIYYTTNGTTPTTSSSVYSGAIPVSSTETLEAIATASGYSTSAVATAAYTITPPAAIPTFSPVAGTYTSAQSVTISDTTAGATIYYTTNGTTPTISSTKYTGAITVSSSETLEAIATLSGYTNSAVASAGYLISPLAVGGMMDWTWMGGSNTVNHAGVYGTLGTPAAGNIPGSHDYAVSWTDSSGHLWIFGGEGEDSAGNFGYLNDLWEFNPTTNQWMWMGGSSTVNHSGVYGTLGTPASGNIPGSRYDATSWIDSSGHLWLFGGQGFGATGSGYLNDLWMFNPSTNQWAWMSGSSTVNQSGVYGTLGTPAAGNIPGRRYEATSWTDSSGHLWLFGGEGYDANGNLGQLNDLWEFIPSTNEWAWMGGSSTEGILGGQPGVYGVLGTPAAGNVPGCRYGTVNWIDSSGHLWLFGGKGYDANSTLGYLNDLWEFNPSTNQWAWMGGSSTVPSFGSGQPGVYGTLGTPAAGNIPGGRYVATSWTDSSGHLWLIGGYGVGANGNGGHLNDLWVLNPTTNQWAWMGGSSTVNQSGVYGTLGTPAAGNIPGSHEGSVSLTDSSGHLWLFGGDGYDANGTIGYFNDLWEYQLPTQLPNATPKVTVTPSLTSLAPTQALTVTVVVGQFGSLTPTGSVVLTGGGYASPSTALSGGSTAFSLAAGSLAVGSYTFTASYTPDSSSSATYNSATGTSPTVIVAVPVTATPVFSVPAGSYSSTQTVTISDATAGATIYYTTNATTPTTSSTVYSGGAITVSSSETLEAIATASGYTTSAVANAGYYITPLAVGGALDWTWMGGSSTALCSGSAGAGGFCGQSGTYGTLGAPAAANRPGGRDSAVSWTDSSGNFWVFGGEGLDSVGTWGILNDLWEFKPSIGQWAWMGGRSTVPGYYQASPGVYGTLGNPAAGNIPMGRENSNAWTDQSGNFWLFGGLIIDASNDFDDLNDLWEFNPSTGQWAWMGGSQTIGSTCYQYPSDYNFCGRAGVYGTLGIGSTSNIPGSRDSSVTWTDKKGNLWLFGGEGEDSAGNFGDLNDLWEFNPSTNQWTWMGGSSTVYQSGVYGTLGTPAAGNIPGSRYGAVSWTDSNGNFWLFGGYGFDSGGNYGSLNDLWEFNPTTNEWTWMGGSSTIAGATGIYGSIGVAAPGNVPSGRQYAAGWTDGNGNFRMLGGVSDSFLNDLWEFNPSSKEWTWIGGSSTVGANGGQPGVYGSLGVAAAGNAPGGRYSSIDWTDRTGNLWLFGGGGFDSGGGYGELNDLWEYQLPTTTPTVTVTPSSTSITTMQGLTVTVAVSAGSDNLTPTGSVILTGTGGFSTNSTALSSGSATINIPAGLLALGSDTFTATYTPDSSSSIIYNSATGTSSAVTVSPVTPTITWATPAAITYGTALSTTQLNASSTVAGTFVYTPASGTLTAGSQTLSVTLTPTDTTDYTTATATVTLTVNKATPAITWPTPAAITYGTALSTTQLNASSTVAGTFAYTPAVGTVLTAGSHTLSVTLTPTDTTDYTTATSTVTQTVNQATPTITWATPAAITYGTALSATQLDATSTVAGTFAYTPAVGSVPNTGAQTLSVTLTPTDTTDYTTATATVQLTVSKAAPAITWPTPAAITYGSALSATQLNASSTVAGTFAYTPASGTVLTAGSHTLSVTLTPTDTTDYTTATSTVTQTVNQATPTITWATPAAITYGTALSATQLDATASVPGTFVYSPAAGTTPAVGSDTLSVTFTPTDATDYTTATASVTLVVTSPLNPVPVVSSISPAFTDAGGAVFTLTVNGSGFIASSTIYWGASALTTTCVSATQLTAQVPAADIATAAGTIAITVQTPAPGGGSSNAWQFEVDSVSSVSTAPTITSTTETVTAGSPASYPVTVPSAVTSVSVTCLNLPTGAACSYSSTTNTVTITTSSTTPKGTYQIVVVFTETVSGAASGFILLPILLLPLGFMRRKLAARGIWLTACLGLVLMATAALSIGCGGGGGSGSTPPPATHQVTSSGAVSLTIQ